MGNSATGNGMTRRQFMTGLAAGTASLGAHAFGARSVISVLTPLHDTITTSDELPKHVVIPSRKSIVPKALSIMMGAANAGLFEKDAALVAREYEVTERDILSYLEEKTDAISRAASLVNRHFPSQSEELCYISASLFLAGWVHGIDTYLMHAISHVESNFSNNMRSRAGAMGCMQVTLNSALFELHSMNMWRGPAERKLRNSLRKLGGMEFKGLVDEPGIERRNGRFRLSQKDDEILMARPLPNAVWAARTLLLKYRGGRMAPGDWQSEREKVKGLLRRYKGIDDKAEMYANNAFHYFRNVYSRLEKPCYS
jgi:hypothetical protein